MRLNSGQIRNLLALREACRKFLKDSDDEPKVANWIIFSLSDSSWKKKTEFSVQNALSGPRNRPILTLRLFAQAFSSQWISCELIPVYISSIRPALRWHREDKSLKASAYAKVLISKEFSLCSNRCSASTTTNELWHCWEWKIKWNDKPRHCKNHWQTAGESALYARHHRHRTAERRLHFYSIFKLYVVWRKTGESSSWNKRISHTQMATIAFHVINGEPCTVNEH